jgi:hypothetical protein
MLGVSDRTFQGLKNEEAVRRRMTCLAAPKMPKI